MKNKIKSIFKILVVTAGCLMFASFSPSLDGRAVVVDSGVFPQGLFAKTVGYLPGDIISVTNIAGDTTIDLLVIGALDPSEGVAIMLSPEAADAMGIDRGANNIVKITKRSGQDERVYGNAVISKSAAEIDDWDDGEYDSIGAEENSDAFEEAEEEAEPKTEEAAEETEDAEEESFEEEAAEDAAAEEENPAEETEEEAFDEAEEEAFEEAPEEEFADEEAPEEETEEEALDEEALPEEEFEDEEEAFEEEALADEELPEVEAPAEEAPLEEAEEEETEEDFEEPEEEAAEEEAFDSEELDQLPEENAEEEFEEETTAEESEEAAEEEAPEEESFAEEAFDEEKPEDLPEEEEPATEEEAEEEAPAEEAFDEEQLEALPEESEPLAEESTEESESEEYEAIVLVPADSNPPESDSDEVEDVVSEDELESIDETITLAPISSINKSVSTVTPVTADEDKPVIGNETSYDKYIVPSLNQLESGKYYIQIAAYGSDANILEIINKYGSNYPITIVPMAGGKTKQVLVGPVTMDEYKVVLERFKSYGFKDAFLRKVK